jgi:hypothetical protein
VLSQNVATAGVPTTVVSSTIKAATLFAAGQAVATGAIPVKVAALTAGVLKSMLLTKLKVATAVLLVAGATLVAGTGILSRQSLAAQEPTNLPQFAVAQGKQPAPQQKVEIIEVKGVVIRKDDVIRQAKHDIDVSLKKLAESKDEKAEQEALDAIEKRVKALKESLKLFKR